MVVIIAIAVKAIIELYTSEELLAVIYINTGLLRKGALLSSGVNRRTVEDFAMAAIPTNNADILAVLS